MSCPHMKSLRPELEPPPSRMQSLPMDDRGYPVPWFVDWIDGKPEFRAMDLKKWIRAVKEKLCWTCGERLGRWMVFVAGPMCGINRTSSEPPSHLECARYAAKNCPFLNNPEAIRRVDDVIGADMSHVAGFALTRNPGVTMLWTCNNYSVFRDQKNRPLLQMGEPSSVEWYSRGKPATREEVLASIESGMPALAAIAQQQDGAIAYLLECRQKFERHIPT